MISINDLSVEFSAKSLFDHINYVINRRDKIALVGKNGAGKSTMLKIIAGQWWHTPFIPALGRQRQVDL